MITLNTRLLFYRLLVWLRPATVLDVGSLDGAHAIRFQRLAPWAKVVAFEANPHNVASILSNPAFQKSGIDLVAKAVSDHDGTVTFYVEGTNKAEPWRKGISSTRSRTEGSLGVKATETPGIRLDSFINGRTDLHAPIALWIDVEGAAYEVLLGLKEARRKVHLIHVEVETRPYWSGQRLKPQVDELLQELDFQCIARGPSDDQHDLVYVRREIARSFPVRLFAKLMQAWLLSKIQIIFGARAFNRVGEAYLKMTLKIRRAR